MHRENGEAKFWIEPEIKLAINYGLSQAQLTRAKRLIEKHENEIPNAWKEHFGS